MPRIALIRDHESGRLVGLTDADERARARLWAKMRNLGDSCLRIEWREPRSGPYHRRFFALMNALFNLQEFFDDLDRLIEWLKIGSGYCDLVPHPTQGVVAIPRSIDFATLDELEFRPIAEAMIAFVHSQYARETLWPHLRDQDSRAMVGAALLESP